MKARRLSCLGPLAAAAALAACGGGGGGTSGPAPIPAPVSITERNESLVTTETVAAALTPMEAAAVSSGLATKSLGPATLTGTVDPVAQALRYARWLPGVTTPAGGIPTKAAQFVSCSGGGSATVDATDADSSGTLSAGDSIYLSFNACVESGIQLGGAMRLNLTALSGTPEYAGTSFFIAASVGFEGFTASGGGDSISASGSLSLSINQTSSNAWTQTVSATRLDIGGVIDGRSETRQMAGYEATATRVPSGFSYITSYTARGTLASNALAGSVTFATPTAFAVEGTASTPSSGQMLITGAGSSRLRLTALAGGNLQSELDADGNGTYESSSIAAWSGF